MMSTQSVKSCTVTTELPPKNIFYKNYQTGTLQFGLVCGLYIIYSENFNIFLVFTFCYSNWILYSREAVCCGTFFRGKFNEIMIDPRFIRPCKSRLATCKLQAGTKKSENDGCEAATTKLYSDSSSDSGYDDCSNQGAPLTDNSFKKDQVSIDMLHRQIPKVN